MDADQDDREVLDEDHRTSSKPVKIDLPFEEAVRRMLRQNDPERGSGKEDGDGESVRGSR